MAKSFSSTSDAEIKKLYEESRLANKKWEQNSAQLWKLSTKGDNLKKENKIHQAIAAYEAAVEYGEATPNLNFANYARNIDAVVILYRKLKDYQGEIEILKRALANNMHPNHKAKYEQRLIRAEELLLKSSNK